jgi:sugar phosphate isomerase/epimerase
MGYALAHGAVAMSDLYRESGLRFGAWGCPDWRGESVKAHENLSLLNKLAPLAAELGIDACCTFISPSSDTPFMDNWMYHLERLRPVAQVLADHGLRLGLEFVAPCHLRRQFSREFIFTPGLMLELADVIGRNVGLLIDSFHLHAAGESMDHIASIPAERIVAVHLNDAPQVPISQLRDMERLLPGEGVIDLHGFIANLKATRYQGPVSLEVFSSDLQRLSPLDAAKRAWHQTAATLHGIW